MSERTKLGLGVLEAAALLGLLGDGLLRATPWGLNVFLWVAAFAAGAHALSRQKGARTTAGEARWLWPVVLGLAACFAWRDSITLKFLDTLTVFAALAVLALGARGGRVYAAGALDYALAACVSAANSLFGAFPLVFSDVKWKEIPLAGWSRHALSVARGLLIAAPLLLIFGALFVAADAIYEGLVRDTFGFDGEIAFTHVLLFAFFAWVTGGYLRGMFLAEKPITSFAGLSSHMSLPAALTSVYASKPGQEHAHAKAAGGGAEGADAPAKSEGGGPARPAHASVTDEPAVSTPPGGYRFSSGEDESAPARDGFEREAATEGAGDETHKAAAGDAVAPTTGAAATREGAARISLGIVEVGVVIGLLDLLFFSFVFVQLRYFFGDARHVITSAGLTFSDYARRGFFELVWVALLALPLLLAAHWLLRKGKPLHEKIFRALAGAMTGMLFVIMASGLWRMRLYQSAYGQTELRFYTTAFMIWLGAVFAWFVLTVLRGRRERFACGALVAWLVVLGALHFVNPGRLIARANVEHARESNRFDRFDAEYTISLGPDAAPAVLEALPQMKQRDRNYVASQLVSWLDQQRQTDWRSWNYARSRAHGLLAENEADLRDWAARWQNELEAERSTAERARQMATPSAQGAVAQIPGTQLFVHVERRPSSAPAAVYRTITLRLGDTAVSSLSLPADDGVRTRVEVLKVSATTYVLQDAFGVYIVDTQRRSLTRHEGGGVAGPNATLIGAFDLDASKTWRFLPAAEARQTANVMKMDSGSSVNTKSTNR